MLNGAVIPLHTKYIREFRTGKRRRRRRDCSITVFALLDCSLSCTIVYSTIDLRLRRSDELIYETKKERENIDV